jgi:ABC-type uncharacterized transport system permease subunit
MPILLYGGATLAYVAAWTLSWKRVTANAASQASKPAVSTSDPARWVLLGAIVLHGASLLVPLAAETLQDLHFGFAQALSAALWLGACLLWLESFTVRVDALHLLVLPAAVAAVWLPGFFPGVDVGGISDEPLFLPHLTAAMLGYSVLTVAALHAVLMALAERALHGGGTRESARLGRWLDSLPPLLVLERMLFRMILLGFVLLTLTVLTGVVFGEEVFGRALRWDHKTVFSLIAWALFGLLLVGRQLWGWRGRTALRLTLGGFGLLVLGYVGSRFVLEVVLERVG